MPEGAAAPAAPPPAEAGVEVQPTAARAAVVDPVIREVYDLVDIDRDGTVSFSELRELVHLVSPTHAHAYATQMFQTGDGDGNMMLDRHEFAQRILPLLAQLGVTPAEVLAKCRQVYGGDKAAEQAAERPSATAVTPEERRKYVRLFEVVDVDDGGSITKNELEAMLEVLKPGATDQDILGMMLLADSDGGGDIDLDEFVLFMRKIEVSCSVEEAVERLEAHFDQVRQRRRASMRMFDSTSEHPVPKGIPAAEAARQRRSARRAEDEQGDKEAQERAALLSQVSSLTEAEAAARAAIADEENAAWGELADRQEKIWAELAAAERREREAERQRQEVSRAQRRQQFFAGGKEAERAYVRSLQQRRQEEARQWTDSKAAHSRVHLEDRIDSQRSVMLCSGTQMKVLRQLLDRGAEYVRLESGRIAKDIEKARTKHCDELSSALQRIDDHLLTIGRALMQESMLLHGSGHKQLLHRFLEGKDYDFAWLGPAGEGGGGGESPRRRRAAQMHRLSAVQLSFSEQSNLAREPSSPQGGIEACFRELKGPLWAIFRHYAGISGQVSRPEAADHDGQMSVADFAKLAGDCRLEIAGGLPVLWVRVLNGAEENDSLGLKRIGQRPAGAPERSLEDRVDYSEFANLLLVVACERYISAPSASPAHKLRCLVLKEMLPLLPREVRAEAALGAAQQRHSLSWRPEVAPSIPGVLHEYESVIAPFVAGLSAAAADYLQAHPRRAPAEAPRRARGAEAPPVSICEPRHFFAALGASPPLPAAAAAQSPLGPPVEVPALQRRLLRHLAGRGCSGEPVLTLGLALDFCAYRAPGVGRGVFREALSRAWGELLGTTFPALPPLHTDALGSAEPVPFPMLLALACRIAVYSEVAAAVPPAPPPEEQLSPPALHVRALCRLLVHPGHYVVTL
eukprot:TRINITY_DN70156_c0_g1_i1.p1 TRINITY_DN70156_c0_g1~~TRINITY_DN70156_c0_g1_i1.p1  ORF type:complete len:913 (+),score=304.72 TRINITY_DN70156_c0_g1_i1:80-2818(+)